MKLTQKGKAELQEFLQYHLIDFPRREFAIADGDFESDIDWLDDGEGFLELGNQWTASGRPVTITFSARRGEVELEPQDIG